MHFNYKHSNKEIWKIKMMFVFLFCISKELLLNRILILSTFFLFFFSQAKDGQSTEGTKCLYDGKYLKFASFYFVQSVPSSSSSSLWCESLFALMESYWPKTIAMRDSLMLTLLEPFAKLPKNSTSKWINIELHIQISTLNILQSVVFISRLVHSIAFS